MNTRRTLLATALTAATLAFAGCGMMNGMKKEMAPNMMSTKLSAASEVPPNSSKGTGTADAKLDGNRLSWTVTYSGTTGPITAGHIHGPAMPGANAPVVIPFTGSMASPITGSAMLTEAQLADLKAGKYYVNLHTVAHPGGEIRGQLN